jgi:hypothetical protein
MIRDPIKEMCASLAKYYWSPLHPKSYVIEGHGETPAGIGLIVDRDYAAFNIAWLIQPRAATTADHRMLLVSWTESTPELTEDQRGVITTHSKERFLIWMKANPNELTPLMRARVN